MRLKFPPIFFFALPIIILSGGGSARAAEPFHFTVINQRATSDDAVLTESLRRAQAVKASFAVVSGVRPLQEVCQDDVYRRRSKVIAESLVPVIVSLAATDWAVCRNEANQSIAQNRLAFLRELFFERDRLQHLKALETIQQSTAVKFRPFSENQRWEFEGVLFATMNLPANNNHYLAAAGRNNEFEDRLVANRNWLQRISSHARQRKIRTIVLFVDANPMNAPARVGQKESRDGFREVRKQLLSMAENFKGKVLLVHAQNTPPKIIWNRNFGVIGAGGKNGLDVSVFPGSKTRFSLKRLTPVKTDAVQAGGVSDVSVKP